MPRGRSKGSGNKLDVSIYSELTTIQRYLNDIPNLPLISAEEEVKLARKIKEGDLHARDKLIEANLRFVISVAQQYQNYGVLLADLIAAGNTGLITAAERFNESKGCKFISYAVWWVRQAILQTLTDYPRVVRLPLNQINLLRRIYRFSNERQQATEKLPTEEEMAKDLGVSVKHLKEVLANGRRILSLDAAFGDDSDNNTLKEILADDRQEPADILLQRSSLKEEIKLALSQLKDRRGAEVIRLYFGLGDIPEMTLGDIGVKFGITRERVRQIKEKALGKLRHPRHGARIKVYAEEDSLTPLSPDKPRKQNHRRVYNRRITNSPKN